MNGGTSVADSSEEILRILSFLKPAILSRYRLFRLEWAILIEFPSHH